MESKKEIERRYTNDETVVVWKPGLCAHSKNCFNGLSAVFNPANRPWVNMKGASTSDIIAQVGRCPSGALSIEGENQNELNTQNITKVEVAKNGPYLLKGPVVVITDDLEEIKDSKMVALCRCGSSSNKPYCDGSHSKIRFSG